MSQFDAMQSAGEESGIGVAFLVVSQDGVHRIVELNENGEIVIGSDPSCDCRLDVPEAQPRHCVVRWSNTKLVAEPVEGARTHRGGRPLEEPMRLDPGDDLTIGNVEIIVGMRVGTDVRRRRALTHAELRERLVEEMARSERVSRTVALVAIRCGFGQGARLARATSETLRAGDLLGSHGPDEIEVVLADVTEREVGVVIDRIGRRGPFALTVGYALAPDDADDADTLFVAAHRALDEAVRDGVELVRAKPLPLVGHEPLGNDAISKEVVTRLNALAPTSNPLILVGERASGRGTLARWVHARSGRPADKVSSITPRSARDSRALAEAVTKAQGGTLILRDVDDWPLEAQQAVRDALPSLRDTRLITTTSRALAVLAERGVIDATLYRAIDGNRVEVPAVRNRPSDLLAFAEHFARVHGAPQPIRFSVGAFARLNAYPWPGNLVELGDAMRRAAQLAGAGEILAEHLPSEPIPTDAAAGRLREHVDSVERDAIIRALADCNQNQTHAARQLGLSRRALIYKMEKYGLKPPAGTAPRRTSSSPPGRKTGRPF